MHRKNERKSCNASGWWEYGRGYITIYMYSKMFSNPYFTFIISLPLSHSLMYICKLRDEDVISKQIKMLRS